MKKTLIVLSILVAVGTCVGGGVIGLAFYAFGASKTFCVVGTRASITIDGPQAILGGGDLPRPSTGAQLLSCPAVLQAPIICRYDAGLRSTYTVRDNGALGITLVGDELCLSLERSAGKSVPRPAGADTDAGASSD